MRCDFFSFSQTDMEEQVSHCAWLIRPTSCPTRFGRALETPILGGTLRTNLCGGSGGERRQENRRDERRADAKRDSQLHIHTYKSCYTAQEEKRREKDKRRRESERETARERDMHSCYKDQEGKRREKRTEDTMRIELERERKRERQHTCDYADFPPEFFGFPDPTTSRASLTIPVL